MWADVNDEEGADINDKKICVDVGGVAFYTMRSTLMKSAYFQRRLVEEEDYIFVDRDPFVFYYILNFLRSNSIHISNEEHALIEALKTESKFYGIIGLEYSLPQTSSKNIMQELIAELKQIKQNLQNSHIRNNHSKNTPKHRTNTETW